MIENEFGEVGIDDALIKPKLKTDTEEDVIEMMNGCICCTVRQDLVEVLKKLAKRSEKGLKLDAIVIETTGLADPAPVAQTFFVCLLYTSPSPRDQRGSRMPSSA